jgi:putative ABC transport system permease protein
VVPAFRVIRTDLITPLKQGGRRSARGRRGFVDRGLVALQMALALLLVSGATLLVQTLRNLQQTDLGFDPSERLAVSVETRRTSYEKQGMTVQLADEMLRRVRAIPGVRSAAFGSYVPIYGGRNVWDNVTVRGGVPPADGDAETWFAAVTPDYFTSLGIPLRAGHDFERSGATTTTASSRDVVVNEQFVNKFFPGRTPIGQVFEDRDAGDTVGTENRVIGVVADAKFAGVRAPARPMYFVPVADHDWPFLVLVVRPTGNALAVGPAIARAIGAVAPGIAQGEPSFLSTAIDDALVRERISATLAMLFGIIALGLVAVGLYGVMLFQVAERTTEIGIRLALGARAGSVIALVLRQSLTIVVIGLVGGVPLAMLAGRAVTSQLYGVAPYDAFALLVAGASLVVVAIAASLVPVRRAIGVDPITALRAE